MNATQIEIPMNYHNHIATEASTTLEATCQATSNSLWAQLKNRLSQLRARLAQPGRRFHDPIEARAYKRQVELNRVRAPYRLYY